MTSRPDPIYTLALVAFADRHRLKSVRLADEGVTSERFIEGRSGLITEYSPTRLHLVLSPGTGNAGWWANRRRSAIAAGMQLDQDGDTEGSLIFDPTDAKQALAAIRISGCKQRRVATEAQIAGIRAFQYQKVRASGAATALKSTAV